MKHITVRYYSFLSAQRGIQTTEVETEAADVKALLDDIRTRNLFRLTATVSKAAVNDVFVDFDAPLADGDSVTFIPPFAGG
ncbi:MAG: MoaD/ThiS family protein [Kiritimatiellae bacterium]|nr:MoaD/ThiS family protein [Kiritimatiellia bacterium]